jgi:quinol monooxygenase YgiN
MTSEIRAIAKVSITEGKINEFRKLATEIIDTIEANEPNTLSYEYFLSDDESQCYVIQAYKDSEAVLAHLRNIADLAGPFHKVAPLTQLIIFGNPSDELRQALESVQPKIFEYWNGVAR